MTTFWVISYAVVIGGGLLVMFRLVELLTYVNKTFQWKPNLIVGSVGVGMLAWAGGLVLGGNGIMGSFEGSRDCREYIEDQEPQLLDTHILGKSLWLRMMDDDHWVAAFRASPRDFGSDAVTTLVCHFPGYRDRSQPVERLELIQGDRLDPIREVTHGNPWRLGWEFLKGHFPG